MKKVRRIFLELLVLTLLVGTSVVSFGQLTASANDPACVSLPCNMASDCGSKCSCNSPSRICVLN